jgi:hypothetical protein
MDAAVTILFFALLAIGVISLATGSDSPEVKEFIQIIKEWMKS